MESSPKAVFSSRLLAWAIDGCLCFLAPATILFTYSRETFNALSRLYYDIPFWALPTITNVYVLLINFYFLYRYEASLGKLVMGIKLRSLENKKLTLPQLLLREIVAKQYSKLTLYGYLHAFFSKEGQALHDVLSDTVVVASKEVSKTTADEAFPKKKAIIQLVLLITIYKVWNDFNSSLKNEKKSKLEGDRQAISLHHLKIQNRQYERREISPKAMDYPDAIPPEEELEKIAQEVYKFDEFLPQDLREDERVKTKREKYEEHYRNKIYQYISKAMEDYYKLKEYHFHADFFKDKSFVDTAMDHCYLKRFPHLREATYSKEANELIRERILGNSGTAFECYPAFIMKDAAFLTEVIKRRESHMEDVLSNHIDPHLQNVKTRLLIDNVEIVLKRNPTKLSIYPLEAFQDKAFLKNLLKGFPQHITYIPPEADLDADTLEEFMKNAYRPERFFSEAQKKRPTIKKLLEKYPNSSKDFIGKYQKGLEPLLTTPPEGRKELIKQLRLIPDQLMDDTSFHIKNLEKTDHPDLYVKFLLLRNKLSPDITNYVMSNCKEGSKYIQVMDMFKETGDTETFAKFLHACQPHMDHTRTIEAHRKRAEVKKHVEELRRKSFD